MKLDEMVICISGLSGCGKTTIGSIVAKKLGLREIKPSFKDEAERRNMELMEFQEMASLDDRYDKELDERIKEEAEKKGCVVTTWLGAWMVNADFRVWLSASEEERARRVSKRENIPYEEALKHIRERDNNNRMRYKKYYGIDIDDKSIFDLVIDTQETPEKTANIIIEKIMEKKGKL